jgi:ribosome-interacting GTPase 1
MKILDNIKNKIKYNHLITNIILLGNKKDIKENNSEAIQLSKEFNISHFEISIKKNIGIDEFTNKITKDFDYVETIMDKE